MDFYFNEKAGRVYDLFISIWVACNQEKYYAELDSLNISIKEDFITLINGVVSILGEDLEKYKKYFNEVNMSNSLVNIEMISTYDSLDSYLQYLETKDIFLIQKELISYMKDFEDNSLTLMDDNMFLEIINDNANLYNYINKANCANNHKWNLLWAINDTKAFKSEFIELIKLYEPKYKKFISKYSQEIEFNIKSLREKVSDSSYIGNTPIGQFVDKHNVETLCIIPSFFNGYTLSQHLSPEDKTSYLIFGKYIDEIFSSSTRESLVDKYVGIFKNLGDLNRYKFIKILSTGEKYGQELADSLNITSATVNYHATNLLLSNLISMKRIENKTYYSLNKKELIDMMEFIKKDLNL